ncbi:MAG: hypothetical protein E5Y63_13270 [Mesorhizobium sp.]|uniref:hypothetical protein n=1 Tax=Mesorhizobium sp. TaxID=1871066 RepID=UPI0011FEDEF2|nr:hypothetical protein [Mesorhizobium sp.]TIM30128.1 MAG: hypothetical protein E5Y63_13270 [Mesorhizobium sp.]
MNSLGFNIQKGEIWYCELAGSRSAPRFVAVDRHRFQPGTTRSELMNLFKQTFSEILARKPYERIGYRLSLDAKSADQLAYLAFSYGILNLVAYERGLTTIEFTSQSFTKRALAYAEGDKFEACDARIEGHPAKWSNAEKLAALSAWMTLDG